MPRERRETENKAGLVRWEVLRHTRKGLLSNRLKMKAKCHLVREAKDRR